MFGFHFRYFRLALGLFLVEVFIALFVHDRIIRPQGGDFLATILLYCLIRSFFSLPTSVAAGVALLVSYLLEVLQYFQLLAHLGWQHSALARVLLGSQFEWPDMLAYTLGAAFIIAIEAARTASATGQTG
ncbi:ribosomal maturation YjgA family protein [Hymenobacter terricola]|uniref:ribosomal maturation YjgA family protein n=1 Tax=Hymenobacter terricola TaxID=2819236 RepID=UPI001B316B26|nr:DUF2809 domain-containing protein [Hymenobacter terricola]